MKIQEKIGWSLLGIVVAVVLGSYQENILGSSPIGGPSPKVASSSVFTLTTTSLDLLGTSSLRIAATVQPRNCTADGQVFLRAQSGAAAVANSGPMVFSTTTLEMGSYPNLPVPTDAVTGITSVGTCTVIVTEWRKTTF